ncbi:hypothetical protein ACJX0J_028131, partial [Zea mays]
MWLLTSSVGKGPVFIIIVLSNLARAIGKDVGKNCCEVSVLWLSQKISEFHFHFISVFFFLNHHPFLWLLTLLKFLFRLMHYFRGGAAHIEIVLEKKEDIIYI